MFISYISSFYSQYANISPDKFLGILYSSNNQGFDLHKLEKDFLLTLILIKFGEIFPDLIFKGGTCLNKIYFPYFRLSEDLDFVMSFSGGRTSRKTILGEYEGDISSELSILGLTLDNERTKYDEHRLCMLNYIYESIIDGSKQTIKVDISLKSQLQLPCSIGYIQSIYIDSILEENIFKQHSINCIDLKESLAEKIRAALTRNIPAIRDFFDIWYVQKYGNFDFNNPDFCKLVDIKLAEVNYKYSLKGSYELLKKQIQTDLQPVLHREYDFSLREIYDFIIRFKK